MDKRRACAHEDLNTFLHYFFVRSQVHLKLRKGEEVQAKAAKVAASCIERMLLLAAAASFSVGKFLSAVPGFTISIRYVCLVSTNMHDGFTCI